MPKHKKNKKKEKKLNPEPIKDEELYSYPEKEKAKEGVLSTHTTFKRENPLDE